MSSLIDEFRSILRKLDPALAVVQVAQRITGIGGPPAEKGLAMLAAAVKAFEDGQAGVMTFAEASEAIDAILRGEVALDAAEDTKLAERFP